MDRYRSDHANICEIDQLPEDQKPLKYANSSLHIISMASKDNSFLSKDSDRMF